MSVAFLACLGGSLPATAQTSTSAGATSVPQSNTLDFANARLADVIRTLGTMLGRTIVLSDVPDARVTFSTAAPVKPGDVQPKPAMPGNQCVKHFEPGFDHFGANAVGGDGGDTVTAHVGGPQ